MASFSDQLNGWLAKAVVEPTPDGYDTTAMTENRRALIAVGTIFTLLGSFAVFCRIVALINHQRRAGNDDWTLFAAFVFSVGFAIASYISVRWGVGLDMDNVPPHWAVKSIQAVYVVEIFYYITVFLIKLSIMFLYWRLASELRNHFYYGTLVMIAVLCVHFLTTIIVFSVQCIPMAKYWDPSVSGQCINITAFFHSTNVVTIITDVIMLALPVRTIWSVPRPKGQKVGVVAAFLCGGLSTLASCIRLYSIRIYTESSEPIRDAAPINTWSFIEIYVGICCASIAVMKQVIVAVRNRSLTPDRKRSNTGETWWACSTPSSGHTHTIIQEKECSRWWSNPEDLEVGRDSDGSPIRQSARLPPSPLYDNSGETALPQMPSQPVLRAFVTWEHDGLSLTNLSETLQHGRHSV